MRLGSNEGLSRPNNCPGAKKENVDCGKRNLPHRGANFCDKAFEGKFAERKQRIQNAYLLKLLDGTLVDSSALVDQVTCMVCKSVVRR